MNSASGTIDRSPPLPLPPRAAGAAGAALHAAGDRPDLVAAGLVVGADHPVLGAGDPLVRVGAAHRFLPRNATAAPASSAAAAVVARLNICGRSLVVTTGSGGKP